MNYASLNQFDVMNGPGVRVSLFVSGCTLNCAGCFNTPAHNFKHGRLFTAHEVSKILAMLDSDDMAGLSILGGDPCEPKNIAEVIQLCAVVKAEYPKKDIWLWTGRTLEELKAQTDPTYARLFELVDVIIDGRFIESAKNPDLRYRGSSNQRVLRRGTDF